MAKLTVTKVTKAIEDHRGNLSMVARKLNVSRVTLYAFIKKYPSVQTVLDDARETMIDNVESALYTKALKGDTASMIFFLKTQGKKRGYVERQEITGADGGAIVVEWDDATNND